MVLTYRMCKCGYVAANDLGSRLREIRDKRGMTQVEVSNATSGVVSESLVAAVETGRRSPSREKLALWLRAMRATGQLDELDRIRVEAKESERRPSVDDRLNRLEELVDRLIPLLERQRPRKGK